MYDEETNNLIHAGKKGMKWGVRNSKTSRDYKAVRPLKKKPASKLSNEDLKKVINRMQLEKQYKTINPRQPTKSFKNAAKIVAAVVATAATINQAVTFAKGPTGQAIKNAVIKKLSINFDNLNF